MRQNLNELKRMQRIAGIITEGEYQEARLKSSSDNEGKETKRLTKSIGSFSQSLSNMGDVDSVTSMIKDFVNKKYPELKVKIEGLSKNQVQIYNKSPKSKVVSTQVGGNGIWEVFVLSDKSYHSTVEEKSKKFGKKPGKEMIQYINEKIKQYLLS